MLIRRISESCLIVYNIKRVVKEIYDKPNHQVIIQDADSELFKDELNKMGLDRMHFAGRYVEV
ncbi:hypothetical protein GO684_02490 [Wolbachia endosymbiont of Litomosoides brasiliensis]|uniref:hypothetical protein n=1 Tax=Wolbachia endosymbiont of Litomosoides brasiliensis TaxID=1812117 RepID=UPI00158BCC39|nr:hypothetical protein [Wolbachia endosymbiont of Litomosoides brasiliensis]NUY39542.1 hypothetical protein [Wolbachia endosymbiont of Litomosoides brasiliensis]